MKKHEDVLPIMANRLFSIGFLALVSFLFDARTLQAEKPGAKLFRKENLVAWCIVPFDSKKRGPAERAEMLSRLEISKVAYDWREEHVATFETEILQYQERRLEFFAFWSWHPAMEPLIRKHNIQPQIWITNPSPAGETQQARLEAAAHNLRPLVEKAKQLDLKLGLYNHGDWGGEPTNLVEVCQHLRTRHATDQIGIIYNFHHGHEHIDDFAEALALMQPYLLCININGMADPAKIASGADKILPVGSGIHEKPMLQIVAASGYNGPIGILDHRMGVDAEQSLRENLAGLQKVAASITSVAE